jgi:hypothetical protein
LVLLLSIAGYVAYIAFVDRSAPRVHVGSEANATVSLTDPYCPGNVSINDAFGRYWYTDALPPRSWSGQTLNGKLKVVSSTSAVFTASTGESLPFRLNTYYWPRDGKSHFSNLDCHMFATD